MLWHNRWIRWMMVLILSVSPSFVNGKDMIDTLAVNQIFRYRSTIDSTLENYRIRAYLKHQIKTDRRNVTLLCVPHMYTLARSKRRSIVGESIVDLTFHDDQPCDAEVVAQTGTMKRPRTMIPNLYGYLTPEIYGTTIISDHLLSPFHRRNRHFYKYYVKSVFGNNVRVDFRPIVKNTQTLRGHAIADISTGRIISCTLAGEYDMVAFEMAMTFGEEGIASLIPQRWMMKCKFSFLGNKLRAVFHAIFGMQPPPNETLPVADAQQYMEDCRPEQLTIDEQTIYEQYDSLKRTRQKDTLVVKEKNFIKNFVWDMIGENLVNRIKGTFGTDARGFYRLSPILNPLYLGYSQRKGITYRFNAKGGYVFDSKKSIEGQIKMGYSFKLHQFMFNMPVKFYFDKPNNGYLKFSWKNGERMTNSSIVDKLKEEHGDTIDWKKMNLTYFRHAKTELVVHYDFNPYLGVETGPVFNRWTSIDDDDFEQVGKPTVYQVTAWNATASIRPLGWKGPVVTCIYERTIPDLSKSRMNYEKWEIDASYLHFLPCLKTLSFRVGTGFYTTSHEKTYFLDFDNFRNDFVPGGWNDEWSGEFELLHRNWYNSSKYYIRMNTTFETPMMLVSWIPYAGHVIEKERLYVSALRLSKLSNYFEIGYGFTTRLVSLGIFTGFKRGSYNSMGVKFGFELFNGW